MDKRGINVGVTKDPCYSRGILSVAALVPWLRPAPWSLPQVPQLQLEQQIRFSSSTSFVFHF